MSKFTTELLPAHNGYVWSNNSGFLKSNRRARRADGEFYEVDGLGIVIHWCDPQRLDSLHLHAFRELPWESTRNVSARLKMVFESVSTDFVWVYQSTRRRRRRRQPKRRSARLSQKSCLLGYNCTSLLM
ncbi:hypothetical protein P3T76_013239 [Phytophthora citrophthora]|uniref:Uncharacterized protein n=1 Tax=Phytophthora citrophthora TaxID=4793 RepID=A0AAD9G4S3_9STRA|nr:hypothetical protein P3T76_013239 [Phytophthora citrophthora]